MIGWQFGNASPVGHIHRVVHVGECEVSLAFEWLLGGAEPPSGAALRLAEDLVVTTLAADAGQVRVAGLAPSGRPVAWVAEAADPPSVSVSHVRGMLGAAVATDGSVGLDIVDPADAGRALDLFFSPEEMALAPDDLGLLRALLWAAKEAAYKAARVDTEFRPRKVTIASLSGNAFTWVVRDRHVVVEGTGRFATVARHVVAIAVTATDEDHPVAGGRGDYVGAAACS